MMRGFLSLGKRGVTTLEFALITPILLLITGGAIDFGLATLGSSQLAIGVSHGTVIAMAQGPTISPAAIVNAVQNGANLAGLANTVTVNVTGPACFCVSGTPVTLSATSTALAGSGCSGTCSAGSAGPYVYLKINASFTYQALMSAWSGLNQRVITQFAVVKLS